MKNHWRSTRVGKEELWDHILYDCDGANDSESQWNGEKERIIHICLIQRLIHGSRNRLRSIKTNKLSVEIVLREILISRDLNLRIAPHQATNFIILVLTSREQLR